MLNQVRSLELVTEIPHLLGDKLYIIVLSLKL